jgi:hypothetical protein
MRRAFERIDGQKYAASTYEKAAGFIVGTYEESITCKGASIVVVIRPVRNGVASGWFSLFLFERRSRYLEE